MSCSRTQHGGGRFRTPTSRSGVRHSTTEPPRSPFEKGLWLTMPSPWQMVWPHVKKKSCNRGSGSSPGKEMERGRTQLKFGLIKRNTWIILILKVRINSFINTFVSPFDVTLEKRSGCTSRVLFETVCFPPVIVLRILSNGNNNMQQTLYKTIAGVQVSFRVSNPNYYTICYNQCKMHRLYRKRNLK